jgi:hypothetical protein
MLKDGLVTGISYTEDSSQPCVTCLEGKQTISKFPKNISKRASDILQLIHSDVMGPMEEISFGGARYYVTFIDDYTRKVFGYTMKEKSEVLSKFKKFKVFVEKQTGKCVKTIRTDNGGEYTSRDFEDYLNSCGIRHQTTVPYTPQQNGVAERTNRTLIEKVRCMLFDCNLSKKYWAEAINTAVYLKNRSPTSAVEGAVPEEMWTGEKIDLSHLKVFGCKAQVHVPKQLRRKLDSKSKEYIMVGYSENTKGYRLQNVNNPRSIIIARDVTFIELTQNNVKKQSVEIEKLSIETVDIQINQENNMPLVEDETEDVQIDLTENQFETLGTYSDPCDIIDVEDNTNGSENRRYPQRERKPKRDKDMIYSFYVNDETEPRDLADIELRSDKKLWKNSMHEKKNSLLENNTWKQKKNISGYCIKEVGLRNNMLSGGVSNYCLVTHCLELSLFSCYFSYINKVYLNYCRINLLLFH